MTDNVIHLAEFRKEPAAIDYWDANPDCQLLLAWLRENNFTWRWTPEDRSLWIEAPIGKGGAKITDTGVREETDRGLDNRAFVPPCIMGWLRKNHQAIVNGWPLLNAPTEAHVRWIR